LNRSAILVVGVAIGFAGNGFMSKGIRSFVDRSVQEIEEVQQAAINITSGLSAVSKDLNQTLIQFNKTINQIASKLLCYSRVTDYCRGCSTCSEYS
jgi:hypothetical protein